MPAFSWPTAWRRHAPFVMWLVKSARPKRIVELGSRNGYSYFTFCKTVHEEDLDTECYAVGAWSADKHSGGCFSAELEAINVENFKYSNFSTVFTEPFDEALNNIEDNSVDFLHINVQLVYEDNAFDLESWLLKLAQNAIIVFHNMEEQSDDIFVQQYCAELYEQFDDFNFTFQNGLRVFFRGDDLSKDLAELRQVAQTELGLEAIRSLFIQHEKRITLAQEFVTLDQEIGQLRRDLEKTQRALAAGQGLLNAARLRPIRTLKRYIVHKILKALAKFSPPIPADMATRFKASSSKRDPRRPIEQAISQDKPLSYEQWVKRVEPNNILSKMRQEKLRTSLQDGPVFSVLIPVYNPDPQLLQECIQSVLDQVYDRVEVCISDDASTNPEVIKVLHECAAADRRVKLVMRKENGHICEASNSALELATGDFIVLLDHDDLLPPHALLYMAKAIYEHPTAQVFYSDEDKIDLDGSRLQPHFKPDFNRDLLYSVNYVSHLGVYSRSLVMENGGFRTGYEGAQDYDLLLRCVAKLSVEQIIHIPHILYHWRMTDNSTARYASNKNYAHDAGKRALRAYFEASEHSNIDVVDGATPFTYKVIWPLPKDPPKVSVLIPTRDKKALVKQAVDSILSLTTYPNFEIIIIDNGSSNLDTLAWFDSICASDSRVRVLEYAKPFNYSAINNFGVENCNGEYICLVNNDVEVISPEWLDEMVSLAVRSDTGCVGAKLYYPNDTIQHGGVIVGIGGVAGHSHKYFPRESGGYFGRLHHRQELSAVTGACLLVSREIYQEVGGLNADDLTVAFNDIDFCLKVTAAGYRNVWTPFAELYHHESISRGSDDEDPQKIKRFKRETAYMNTTWNTRVFKDPHYNVNLTTKMEDFSLGS